MNLYIIEDNEPRLATDAELEAELAARKQPAKAEVPRLWRPKDGEGYYYVNPYPGFSLFRCNSDSTDAGIFAAHNCYPPGTDMKAVAALEKACRFNRQTCDMFVSGWQFGATYFTVGWLDGKFQVFEYGRHSIESPYRFPTRELAEAWLAYVNPDDANESVQSSLKIEWKIKE